MELAVDVTVLHGSVALLGPALLSLVAIFESAAVRGSALTGDNAGSPHPRCGTSTMHEVSAWPYDLAVRSIESYPGVRTGPRTIAQDVP
jgi:hypothetical protein